MLPMVEKDTPVLQEEAQRLYGLLGNVSKTKAEKWTLQDCLSAAPYTLAINRIKKEKNAVILAHSYTTPDLVYGVADFRGDSYELALKARASSAEVSNFFSNAPISSGGICSPNAQAVSCSKFSDVASKSVCRSLNVRVRSIRK